MNKQFVKELIYLTGFILLVIFISIGLKSLLISDKKFDNIPVSVEIKLKELIKKQINIDSGVIKGKRINRAVKTITHRLKANMEEELPYEIEIIIIDSSMINAAAFPGGLIIVFTGLIKATDSPEECAAVLAHEIGHVAYKDSLKKIARQFGIAVLISMSGGHESAMVLKKMMRAVAESSFSRKQEERADQYAFELMIKSGLSPRHFATFMKKLANKSLSKKTKKILKYINSHPDTEERIEKAYKKAKLFRGKEHKFNINWSRTKRSLPSVFNY